MEKLSVGKAFQTHVDGDNVTNQLVDEHHDTIHEAMQAGPVIPGTPEFCLLWTVARPILVTVKAMLFFKPKWRLIVTGLIGGLDAVCNPPAEQ